MTAQRAAHSLRMSNWSRQIRSYHGFLITEDGECTMEFCIRLNRGQAIAASVQKIWKSHSIPISTKIRLMKAVV